MMVVSALLLIEQGLQFHSTIAMRDNNVTQLMLVAVESVCWASLMGTRVGESGSMWGMKIISFCSNYTVPARNNLQAICSFETEIASVRKVRTASEMGWSCRR